MRIAIAIWDLNIKGGTQRQAIELAASLHEGGHDVTVYSYVYDQVKCYELCEKLKIHSLKKGSQSAPQPAQPSFIKRLVRFVDSMFYHSSARELAKLILKDSKIEPYDVINLHDYEVYKMAPYLKHSNIVWMMNDVVGIPASYREDASEKLSFTARVYSRVVFWVTQKKINHINKIVVLDNWNKKLCANYYNREAIVVRSGIDLDLYKNTKIVKNQKGIEIFANGIFFPHRRFEDLVRAMKIVADSGVKNVHLTINGSNARAYEYYLFVKKLITSNKLQKNITLVNGMAEQELLNTYASANIFVFPNHNQTWGLSVFEAMLAGCICIVSKTCGASEVLKDKTNAYLVDPKSPDKIAKAIIEIAGQSKEQIKKTSEAAVTFVQKNISWGKYAKGMLEVFQPEK